MKIPVIEARHEQQYREERHFSKIVEVDAKKLWTDSYCRILSRKYDKGIKRTWNNSYPLVEMRNGKNIITDGRHRITIAAERGYRMDIAVPPNQVEIFIQRYDGVEICQAPKK